MAIPRSLSKEDAWPDAPRRMVVVGPPGTGKSQWIVDSFVTPALAAGVALEGIVVLSFTRAAAEVLRRRIRGRFDVAERTLRASVSTLHSRAWRPVAEARALYSLGQGFVPIHPTKGEQASPECALDPDDAPEVDGKDDPFIATYGEHRARAALRLHDLVRHLCAPEERTVELALRTCPEFSARELLRVIEDFERMKREHAAVDFTDVVVRAATASPDTLEPSILIVDECQDLTPLMWSVVLRWASEAEHAVFVGDPDQSIYAFAGASPKRLLRFMRQFETRRLDVSHRVPRRVHQLARRVIALCSGRVDSPYAPAGHEGVVSYGTKADAIARVLLALREGHSTFILCRAGHQAQRWSRTLRQRSLPHSLQAGSAKSRSIATPRDSVSGRALRAIVHLREGRMPSAEDLKALVEQLPVRKTDFRYFPANKRVAPPPDGIYSVRALEDRGVDFGPLLEAPTHRAAAQRARLQLDFLASELDLLDRIGIHAFSDPPCVAVSTMHRSKGLQAAVVVVDLEMPKTVARAIAWDPAVRDDELRVLYVSITRAMRELVLVHGSYAEQFPEARFADVERDAS